MFRRLMHGCLALAVGLCSTAVLSAAPPAAEGLLPASTKSCFVIPKFPESVARWEKTGFGKLFAEPAMQPFVDDLKRQFESADRTKLRLALTLDDIRALAVGEVAWGTVHTADTVPAQFLLLDVTGKSDAAIALLDTLAAKFVAGGYQRSTADSAGAQLTLLVPPSGQSANDAKLRTAKAWFVQGDLLAITESQTLAEQLATALGNSAPTNSLKQHAAYQAIVERTTRDAAGASVDLRWYIDPFGLIAAERAADPRLKPKKKPDPFEVYRKEGFTALQALGGVVQLNLGNADVVHRTFVFAPPPYQRAMRMLKTLNVKLTDLAPPAWVTQNVASCIVGQIDTLHAFDHYGTLFDALYGEGDEGLWNDLLEGWAVDPKGPKVKVRGEIVEQLANRMTQVTEYREPIAPDNARVVSTLEIKPGAAIDKPLDRLLDGEPTVKPTTLSGVRAFEVFNDERQKPPPASVTAVVKGQLFSSTHADALADFVAADAQAPPLSAAASFQAAQQAAAKLGLTEACLLAFGDTARQLHTPYELFRTGRLHELEDNSLAGVMLKRIVPTEAQADAPARQSLTGDKLPAFEAVRKFLGPSATLGTSEAQGWYLTGVVLNSPQ